VLGKEPRIQPPVLDAFSDLPLYNTKAVVHQTAVPAPTLRAWERRYGILAPRRAENDYRLYSERDIMLVLWLREQVEAGMTISQAIALLRTVEPARRRGRRSRANATNHETPLPIFASAAVASGMALPELRASLLRAFATLDEAAVSHIVAQALAVYAVEDVCVSLIGESLVEVGQQWAEGRLSVTCEHFATATVRAQLEGMFRSAPAAADGPLALVGCAPGEMHELGALIVALFLRRAGMRVAYLGQSVEIGSLLTTVATVRPSCVLLSASGRVYAEALPEVGLRIAHACKPAPLFGFGGRAFVAHPELAERIPGQFLDGDARQVVPGIKKRLAG
jgi:DNA-binding transcriptional MerR regulator